MYGGISSGYVFWTVAFFYSKVPNFNNTPRLVQRAINLKKTEIGLGKRWKYQTLTKTLWSIWASLCDVFVINKTLRSDTAWFLRVGQERPYSFCGVLLAHLLSEHFPPACSLSEFSYHAVRKPSQMERPHVGAPDDRFSWPQPLSQGPDPGVKTSPDGSPAFWTIPAVWVFPAEFWDTVEQWQTVTVSFICQTCLGDSISYSIKY